MIILLGLSKKETFMNLNVEKWKEFRIGDFFDAYTGEDLVLRDNNAGNIPVCTHSSENNGVGAYVCEIPERELFSCERSICLADRGTFHATVQTRDYYIGTRVKSLVLKDNINISVLPLFFITTLLNNESYRYSYGRNCTNRVEDIVIKLPEDKNGEPDWDLMEKYIISLKYKKITTNIHKKLIDLNINTWVEYRFDHLFRIIKGTRLIKEDMEDGNVNYLGAISGNNGVRQKISCQESDLYAPNCITVNYNGSVGEAFYQKDPFWASDDVNVLYAKDCWQLNVYRAMFIITIIKANKYKYDYGRKWTMEKMKESTILLPSKADGTPDWDWMENYIKSLPYSDRI